jgi:hypothetical protein
MTTDEMEVVGMMRVYGGSFVKALAHAMLLADSVNFAVLRDAFPVYWRHYAALRAEGKQQIDHALRKPE